MTRKYRRTPCRHCGAMVTTNALGRAAHARGDQCKPRQNGSGLTPGGPIKTITTNHGAVKVYGGGWYRFEFNGVMSVLNGQHTFHSEQQAIDAYLGMIDTYNNAGKG